MQIENIDEAVERLYDLNVGVIGTGSARHERPHKPLLILAALDLIASGKATATHIGWSNNLRERFTSYFEKVRIGMTPIRRITRFCISEATDSGSPSRWSTMQNVR
jgi:hypothetical protein